MRTYRAGRVKDSGVQRELLKIEAAANAADSFLELQQLNAAPDRVRTGMVVLADGTNWDPGSGAGFYGYYGGGWVKLG